MISSTCSPSAPVARPEPPPAPSRKSSRPMPRDDVDVARRPGARDATRPRRAGTAARRRRRCSDRAPRACPPVPCTSMGAAKVAVPSKLVVSVRQRSAAVREDAGHVGVDLDRDALARARPGLDEPLLQRPDRRPHHRPHGPEQVDQRGEVVRPHVEERPAARRGSRSRGCGCHRSWPAVIIIADAAVGTPMAPASIAARAVCVPVPSTVSGAQPTRTPAAAAASMIARPSSSVTASGFSP